MNRDSYVRLAGLFDYPDASFLEKVMELEAWLKGFCPAAAAELGLFAGGLSQKDPACLQELFTRSFDIQAVTTLDVGYVLFGDDYKRGSLLAHLNREHKDAGNDCGLELADHLPNLLRLIAKSEKTEFVQELVEEILAPAIRSMIGEFDPEKLGKKNQLYQKHYKTLLETAEVNAFVYLHALKALLCVLKQDFQIREESICAPPDHGFFKAVDLEMSVEKL